ncbi:MAG: ABC transporter [Frankiales bacterium]|nr:ABC transporter [Frankiales bacterium]
MSRSGWLLLAPAGALLAVLGVALASGLLQSLGADSLTGDGRLSLDAYRALLGDEPVVSSLGVGLVVASAATCLAITTGLLTVAAVRAGRRTGRVVATLAAATVPLPHLVGAVAFALLLSDSGFLARIVHAAPGSFPPWVGGHWYAAVVLELAWKESAFIALVVLAALPADLEEREDALAVLGAGARRRWLAVSLPASRTALVVASTVAFTYALGSYEVAWLLGPALPETLPETAYRLFTSTDFAARPEAFAATSVLVTACLGATLAGLSLLRSPARTTP